MRLPRSLCMMLILFFISVTVCLGAQPHLEVKEFFLDNGMQFLVVERPATPQVSCRLAIRAGSALEESGKTGIAHLLEHMLFKGTKNFGTTDYKKDLELQTQIEQCYQTILAEDRKSKPDQALIKKKQDEMSHLRQEVKAIYVPQAFSSQLSRNGAIGTNAFTTPDQTQFMVSVPADMLEQWFSIASEQIFEPSWREFYVEKEVVQREWAYRYVNNPGGAAWLDLFATAYQAHPYHNPTIGWRSDMKYFNTTDAMQFHDTYYNPTDAVCVLVGDVTVEKAQKLAQIYFARYPAGQRSPELVTAEPLQQGPRKSIRYLKGARTPLVYMGFHAADMGSSDFYALDALVMILSYGQSARLNQQIVNKGLAASAWAYNPDNRYGGTFIFAGSPNEPEAIPPPTDDGLKKRALYQKACESFEALMHKQIEKLKTEPVTERELNRIKKLIERDHLERMRNNNSLAAFLATLEVQVGWRYMQDYLDKMSRVTPKDIQDVVNKYMRLENQSSIYIIPGGKPDHPPEQYSEVRTVAASVAAQKPIPVSFKNHSRYPTPAGWKHPLSFERHPKKITYPPADQFTIGQSTVFYLADHELPFIEMTLLCKAGSVDLKESQIGLTHVLNQSVIRGGTEKYAPEELAQVLDENAIRVSFSAGEEKTAIHLSVLKDDWQKGLTLLREILLHPRFDHQVVEVIKKQALTALKRQGGDAQAVASREAAIWHFKGHPYGRDPLKGLETIPPLTSKDLSAFLKTYLKTPNLIVTIAGDIEKEEARQTLTGFLSAFPDDPAPERHLAAPPVTPPVLALINKPGQVQSQVSMVLPCAKRTDPDYWKIRLLTDIFGGPESLLYIRLRDDLGLVYAAGFYETYKWQTGLIGGYIGCKGDKTAQAIGETIKLMKTTRQNVPEKLFHQKRLDALNSFVFNVDSPFALVNVYGQYFMRNESLNTLDRIQEAFIQARQKEMTKMAQKWLDPRKLQIFIVGDKAIPVQTADGKTRTLEADLKDLARKINLPFREITLR